MRLPVGRLMALEDAITLIVKPGQRVGRCGCSRPRQHPFHALWSVFLPARSPVAALGKRPGDGAEAPPFARLWAPSV